ncbi:MAG: hypothetical protein IJ636_08240 [Bacteroidales bacterium]|nr:hypothetical protein [Bacteroidales bacterium]
MLARKKNGCYSAIAFVMDNDDDRCYLKDCSMSINELEKLSGFDFFPALDATLPLEKLIVCRLPFGLCFDGRLTRFSFEKYG